MFTLLSCGNKKKPVPDVVVETKTVYLMPEDEWLIKPRRPHIQNNSMREAGLEITKLQSYAQQLEAMIDKIVKWKKKALLDSVN